MVDFEKVWEELGAPQGKFRVVGVDKFQIPGEGHFLVGDFDTLQVALNVAFGKTREASKDATSPDIAIIYYVYDETGAYRGGNVKDWKKIGGSKLGYEVIEFDTEGSGNDYND